MEVTSSGGPLEAPASGITPPRPPVLGVVVVAYNSQEVIGDLIASLAQHEADAAVVVVDSASPTGPPSVEAPVVVLAKNRGYGAAANAGAAWLLERYPALSAIAFLNPDVRLRGSSLTQLLSQMNCRSAVGISTGPLVSSIGKRLPSAWGRDSMVRRFWYATGWHAPRVRALLGRMTSRGAMISSASVSRDDLLVEGFVRGGTMLVRAECWRQVAGFDEDFFMFGEDVDLCTRVREAGWQVRVLPCDPIVLDDRGSSSASDASRRFQWYVEGSRRYAQKHLDDPAARRLERALRWGRRVGRRR